jgi:hypothetical protein
VAKIFWNFSKKLGKKFPGNREYVTNITNFFIFNFQKKEKEKADKNLDPFQ